MAHILPQTQGEKQTTYQGHEPLSVQLDPKCLHSALKEFFDPLRTNDSRTDFFTVYRKESAEFDRDCVGKYDQDLNTSLIFAGLFSAVSSAFIIDIQSNLQPDPNEMTAAYMRILIHAVNSSLFPDADPSFVAWTGLSTQIIIVQSLLYASLATSLFSAFLGMLGKQWLNRYVRNRGGSPADKSRNRQRKLDGLEKWHFHLTIESLPIMLQFALLLLGFALSLYLWTINRQISWVILGFTLFGVASYTVFTIAAAFYYSCPYQTPPSILVRTLIGYLKDNGIIPAHLLRSLVAPMTGAYFTFAKNLRRIVKRFRVGIRGALTDTGRTPGVPSEREHVPLAVVESPPPQLFPFDEDLEVFKGDARCISWILHSATDTDVIFSTIRFAVDTIWYPEIAQALSPQILADLFLDCLVGGRVISDRLEYASSAGMALASVLSVQLCMEPERDDLKELCDRLYYNSKRVTSSEPTFLLGVVILRIVSETPSRLWRGNFLRRGIFADMPDHLPSTHKLCLSRILLQTVWRWRRIQDTAIAFDFEAMEDVCNMLMADGDHILPVLKVNYLLTMAVSLGLRINDVHDLYAPNKGESLATAILVFDEQLRASIRGGKADLRALTSILSSLGHLDPFRVTGSGELGFAWIAEILNSGYSEAGRYQMAGIVMEMLGKEIGSYPPKYFIHGWVSPLLDFLLLGEKVYESGSPPYPGSIALRILLFGPGYAQLGPKILPFLASALLPTHPLQSRRLALKVFHRFMSGWFASEMDNISNKDLDKLLRAVNDPFESTPDLPLQNGDSKDTAGDEPMMAMVVLIEFASSDLWRNHLNRSNFASCEEIVSTEEGKRKVIGCMLDTATHTWSKYLSTPARISAAVRRLEELQCLNTAEVLILWAWTVGVMDAVDCDAWRLIGRNTLEFYRTHGTGHLPVALKRHIVDTDGTMEMKHSNFLLRHYRGPPCRVGSVRSPIPVVEELEEFGLEYLADLRISQVCQLRRLYHLFGMAT